MADISINIDDEKLDKLDAIYKKMNKLMKEEIDKISPDDTEKIIFSYILIDSLYHSDKDALGLMGLKIRRDY